MTIRRKNDPIDLVLTRTIITRLGCWEIQNKPGKSGYVCVTDYRDGKKQLLAHRVTYEHFNGPIPEGFSWTISAGIGSA